MPKNTKNLGSGNGWMSSGYKSGRPLTVMSGIPYVIEEIPMMMQPQNKEEIPGKRPEVKVTSLDEPRAIQTTAMSGEVSL